jgi:hypothetical protein
MNDDGLDRDVREALEPDSGAVERIMRGALNPRRHPRRVRGLMLVAAGAVAVLCVGAVLLNRATPGRPPETTRMTNIHDTIVVTPAAGPVWLIGVQGRGDDRLPVGTIIVHRSGEPR